MKEHRYRAETLAQFSSIVETKTDAWRDSEDSYFPWFRGQKRAAWKLLPSAFRDRKFSRGEEDEMREEFVLRSPALSQEESIPQDDWNAYFMMQHYGAPTRLLDWTESPLLALYFALKENYGYYDAAVWMMDPHELNGVAIGNDSVIAPGAPGVGPKDNNRVYPWLARRFDPPSVLPELPVAIFPIHFARRISSQRSCFTIHGRLPNGFDSFVRRSNYLIRIVIPAYSVKSIRKSLTLHGIDETMIFPDLAGLCRVLSERWCVRRETKPHIGTFVRLKPSKAKTGDVGIFAIRPIKKNTKVFSGENEEIVWSAKDSIPKDKPLRKLYEDFAIEKRGRYGTPPSFNRLTPAWYIQDSKSPNMKSDEDYDFYALRDIRSGEELTVDYATLSN